MEPFERLQEARKLAGYAAASDAAKAMGIREPTYLGHENGSRGIRGDVGRRYAEFFRVSPEWLLWGRGKPKPSRLVSSFDPDAPEPRESDLPLDGERVEAAARFERRELRPGEIVERDARGGMGPGGGAGQIAIEGRVVDDVRAVWTLPADFIHAELRVREPDLEILQVYGDSMMPTLLPGDRVFVHRREQSPSPDGVFAIDDGIGVAVKRLQIVRGSDPLMVRIISDNPVHPVDTIPADHLRVIGRVVGKVSRL